MRNSAQAQTYDITIIGGGMVGLLAAIRLLHADVPVAAAIIDRADLSQLQPEFNARCIALSHGTVVLLQSLGVWASLATSQRIERIHVSTRSRFGSSVLNANDYFDTDHAFGHVVSHTQLINALLSRLHALQKQRSETCRVDFFSRSEVQYVQRESHLPQLTPLRSQQAPIAGTTENGWSVKVRPLVLNEALNDKSAENIQRDTHSDTLYDTLYSHTLIISDGARSTTRAHLGFSCEHEAYPYEGLAFTVTAEKPQYGTAFERFLMPGTLALLPLSDNKFGVVWTMPIAQAQAFKQRTATEQAAHLQAAFGWRMGQLSMASAPASYPLHKIIATTPSIPQAYLLGNAAHNLHPVAGQGFNLSARDACALGDLLIKHALDYASISADFAQQRTADQLRTYALSDGLPKLFDVDSPLSDVARQAGLLVFGSLSASLKQPFVSQAMGVK